MFGSRTAPFEFPRVGDLVFMGPEDRRFDFVAALVLEADPGRFPVAYLAELESGERVWVRRLRALDALVAAGGAVRRGARPASGSLGRLGEVLRDETPRPRAYVRLT